jgi:hypothetical protein
LNLAYAILDLIVIGVTFLLFQAPKEREILKNIGTDLYHLLDVLYFSSYFLVAIAAALFGRELKPVNPNT